MQEGVGAQQLCINSDEAMNNTRLLYKELTSLREHLARVFILLYMQFFKVVSGYSGSPSVVLE